MDHNKGRDIKKFLKQYSVVVLPTVPQGVKVNVLGLVALFIPAQLIQKINICFLIVLCMVAFDFIFAMAKVFIKKEKITSHALWNTPLKLFVSYMLLSMFAVLSVLCLNGETYMFKVLSDVWVWCMNVLTISIILTEVRSLFETAEDLGFNIPKAIKNKLNKVQKDYAKAEETAKKEGDE